VTPDPLVRRTTAGEVRGIHLEGALAWRGIPFAAPPIGERRFRAPSKPDAWDGIRDASEYGPVAAQDRKGPFGGAAKGVPTSEDCLTLNVLSPDSPGEKPVMVYIHGGAYSVGSPPAVPNRGINFVRRGIVHVTLNYRLNAFGYLDFSEFGFDNNLGLRDQVAALEWVRDNIREFGGDPNNVTLYGESSGGNAVTTLLGTPAARGLFSRAIAQSAPSYAVYRPQVTREWARDFMTLLGAKPGGEADALRTSSTEALVTAARLQFAQVPDLYPGDQAFSPVIDGDFLPEHPVDAIRAGRGNPVPLIIGTNRREGSVFWGKRRILATDPTRIAGLLAATPPEGVRAMHEVYRFPSREGSLDFGGDFAFFLPSYKIAEKHSEVAPTWLYRLDYAPPALRVAQIDATHGLDLLTVFGRTRTWVGRLATLLGGRRAFDAVSARMQEHWARFALTGTVDSAWPTYDARERRSLIFDHPDRVESDSLADRRRAWDLFNHVHETE
jgi:para-nitrobenzyl esterase